MMAWVRSCCIIPRTIAPISRQLCTSCPVWKIGSTNPATFKKTVTHVELPDGKFMPVIGFGMWQIDKSYLVEQCLDKALAVGYRHFDTAFAYQNEEAFGHVLQRWFKTGKVQRQDLFIVTKLPIQAVHPDRVSYFLDLSLKRLQLNHVDLYLVHNPACLQVDDSKIELAIDKSGKVILDTSSKLEDTWKKMEVQVIAGKTVAVGMSNFSLAQIERIVNVATIGPANLQVELNAFCPQKKLRELCAKHAITVTAYAPLGSPGRGIWYKNERGFELKSEVPNLIRNPVVFEISKKYNKTTPQILLKFLVQQGVTVIPKSVTNARIEENFDIFNFELDEDSMKKLDSLNTGKPGQFGMDWLQVFPGLDRHPEFQMELP